MVWLYSPQNRILDSVSVAQALVEVEVEIEVEVEDFLNLTSALTFQQQFHIFQVHLVFLLLWHFQLLLQLVFYLINAFKSEPKYKICFSKS